MRICQLLSSYQQSSSPFRDIDPYPDAARWLPEHQWTTRLVDKASIAKTIDEVVSQGFDLYVNLCDGAPDEDLAGIEVVERLEWHGVPFTGPNSRMYGLDASRQRLKQICLSIGIGTPKHAFLDGSAPLTERLRPPLIVKPRNGYASIGIERSSRVTTEQELQAACARTLARFGGVLLEEFIEGREFTVFGAEPVSPGEPPLLFPPFEIVFPPGETFKHFDLKWQDYAQMGCREVSDPALHAALQQMVQRLIEGTDGVGYCRCDIRMDQDGQLYLLDCNVPPGLFYPEQSYGSADFIVSSVPDGHRRLLQHLIACAFRRAAPRGALLDRARQTEQSDSASRIS
jgi:D-alanine-D-alanine ligase